MNILNRILRIYTQEDFVNILKKIFLNILKRINLASTYHKLFINYPQKYKYS